MKHKSLCASLIICLLAPVVGVAADFELFWDPNCNADQALEGYYIYYKENASVVDDPSGATKIYVSVSDDGFDRNQPSRQIYNLSNDVRYCFAVTAWYGDEESGMSNEICGINGGLHSEPDPDPNLQPVIITVVEVQGKIKVCCHADCIRSK